MDSPLLWLLGVVWKWISDAEWTQGGVYVKEGSRTLGRAPIKPQPSEYVQCMFHVLNRLLPQASKKPRDGRVSNSTSDHPQHQSSLAGINHAADLPLRCFQ